MVTKAPIEFDELRMPAPYDTVISIGGQSLVEGVWRCQIT
jgi:hypothetical protein